MRFLATRIATVALMTSVTLAAPAVAAGEKRDHDLVVCKHGCEFRTIQEAVDRAKQTRTHREVVLIRPGKYREGVIARGRRLNGLTIRGSSRNPRKVILEGRNAKDPIGNPANNGIEGVDVRNLTLANMWARNYVANGFFVRDSNPGPALKRINCRNYLMKNLRATYNRAYGLYAFGCIGGRMTRSTGVGTGDAAFYVGATPPQKRPRWTSLDHLDGHLNVLGFSGTNARYIRIHDSAFYNNGAGVVPNTLDSEPYEPTASGVIEDNDIFWNNLNYFLPDSPTETVTIGALGTIGGAPIQLPTGVGVAMLGGQGWKIRDNRIFGNYKWGLALISNPLNAGRDALSRDNAVTDNEMGRGGGDPNAVDFWADGSGKGNCFSDNSSSTLDPGGHPESFLYPPCPAPAAAGTGTDQGDAVQFAEIVDYALTDPPQNQECSWTQRPHPPFKSYRPVSVTPGPDCDP